MIESRAGMPMRRDLTVTFAPKGSGWEFTLSLDREAPLGPFPWSPPVVPKMLFHVLFGPVSRIVESNDPWRVRIRPATLSATPDPSALPALPSWSYLVHPRERVHVFNLSWTLAEESVAMTFHDVRDAIAVLPTPGSTLADALSRELMHPVETVSASGPLPDQTVLIVEGALDGDEAADLQQRAFDANCPLIVWCASSPPPSMPVNEIVTVDATETPTLEWLSLLLPRVLAGDEGPEAAMAYAAQHVRYPGDSLRRWLRGRFDGWKTRATVDRHGFPEHWEVTFDRTDQENELTGLADTLVAKGTRRRVQTVFSAGPDGAGLRAFQKRPPLWREGTDQRVHVERIELDWHDDPALQIHRVCHAIKARDLTEIAPRLEGDANRCAKATYLLWLAHRVVSLRGDIAGARVVSIDALQKYNAMLLDLGRQLPAKVRLLAHISVIGATASELATLGGRPGEHGHAKVLSELTPNVSEDDLRTWFDRHGQTVTDEEITLLARDSFEVTIRKLQRRFSAYEDR